MKKFTLMFLVLMMGTSCQVYKKNHVGGYTFKWKSVEKKAPKVLKDKSQQDQIASFEDKAKAHQTKSFVGDDVKIETGEWVTPVLEQGEAFTPAGNKQLNLDNKSIDNNEQALNKTDVVIQEFIDLFTYLKLMPEPSAKSAASASAPMASNSSGWQSILGFVLSLLGLVLMFTPLGLLGLVFVIGGMVFSIIGLGTGEYRGLAIAGIIISAIALFILLLLVLLFAAVLAAF